MKFNKGDIVKYVNPVDKWAKEGGLKLGETYIVGPLIATDAVVVEGCPFWIRTECFILETPPFDKIVEQILKM